MGRKPPFDFTKGFHGMRRAAVQLARLNGSCDKELHLRATGRTTGIALGLLSTAIRAPNVWHYCYDHFPGIGARRNLTRCCSVLAKQIGLEGLEIDTVECAVRFHLEDLSEKKQSRKESGQPSPILASPRENPQERT